jgi:hypothetical protein
MHADSHAPESGERYARRLLPITFAYLPVVAGGAVLSLVYDVGATPTGRAAADLPFRGGPLAPPLFLPVLLLLGSAAARRRGVAGTVGASLCTLVGLAFAAGSTFNLPNDLAAAAAAGSPQWLTWVLAGIHFPLGLALAFHGGATLRERGRARRRLREAVGRGA